MTPQLTPEEFDKIARWYGIEDFGLLKEMIVEIAHSRAETAREEVIKELLDEIDHNSPVCHDRITKCDCTETEHERGLELENWFIELLSSKVEPKPPQEA